MAKINALLKISVLLMAAALALMPYAAAFEVVGDDMNYILSHVSKEEWEAAKKLWSSTIQLNINEGTEIPSDLGIVLQPSLSEWGIKKDPSNPSVYILTLTGLPKKPFSGQKAQTAAVEQLSPEEQESREAEQIARQLWNNRSNDRDNITFTAPSTRSKWLFVPINYKHQLYNYGKLNAKGHVENFIGESEAVSIEDLIEEWTAEGKNVSQLIALQKQTQELIAKHDADLKKEAAASSSKSGKKEPPLAVASAEKRTSSQTKTTTKETLATSTEQAIKKQGASSSVAAGISLDNKTGDAQQTSKGETANPKIIEQNPKKRVSFFERILNWFR